MRYGTATVNLNIVGTVRYPGAEAVDRLIDEYRDRCLWFLRTDFYPADPEEARRVLGYIERHGDLEAFRKAAEMRRWLLHPSNAPSAPS